jgi:hypothetical protein
MKNSDNKLGVALVKRACPLCGGTQDAEIVMNTRLTQGAASKVEELHGKTIGMLDGPCDSCKDLMSKGFLLIGVVEAKTEDVKNPYRSGNQWVVSNEAAQRMFPEDYLKKGAAFVDIHDAVKMGLPDVNLTA